jgi:Domain of unknown function (DUF4917)
MASDAIDGSLLPWSVVARKHNWTALLLGNGVSINVWPHFAYGSLFDHARQGRLTQVDRALFDGTRNFERALSDLMTAMRVNDALGIGVEPILARYRSIQVALGRAIQEVHLNRARIPDATFQAIRDHLLRYEWVFTTSYDLILYWAMKGPDGWEPFVDHFRHGGRCEFDAGKAKVYRGDVPVYFLHGALHLVVGSTGITWKLRRTGLQGLLDQFGKPIDGDPRARPLLVTEGSAKEKLRAIEGNAYLSHALERLQGLSLPTVVFGSSLSVHDAHLIEALNEHPRRPVAISLLPAPKREVAARKAELLGRLDCEQVLFFDARSHPLGASALTAPSRAVRGAS